MILNLKDFNESVEYERFKMENLFGYVHDEERLLQHWCLWIYAMHIILYRSIQIFENFSSLNGVVSCMPAYTCFANGLANCPRYFTKLLMPVYACPPQIAGLSFGFKGTSCS